MHSPLLESLHHLCETLPGQAPSPELAGELAALREVCLNGLEVYADEAPEGAENLYEAMKAGMELYLGAIDEVEAYLDDSEPHRLEQAARLAQEAEDSFGMAEYEITQTQSWLGEYQQG